MTVITGDRELLRTLDKFSLDIDKMIDGGVKAAAVTMRGDVVKSIQDQGVGSYVTRYTEAGKPYLHVASKAGDAPNTDTGRLASSIKFRHEKDTQTAYVETDIEYAPHLEFGTSKMAARPFLQPAAERAPEYIESGIKSVIEQAIKKAAI